MNDLISRQAAIDALENDKAELDKIIKGMSAEDMLLKYFVAQHNQVSCDIDAIVQLPSIQPKRGRWEMGIDERFVECSECGLMTTRNELRGLAVFGKNEPNFCPNCGAKMEVNHESN